MSDFPLLFAEHLARMQRVHIAATYTVRALDKQAAIDAENPRIQSAKKQMFDGLGMIAESIEPKLDAKPEELWKVVEQTANFAEPARQIVLNLVLVTMCTELEVFIAHLIHVVLGTRPEVIKSVASQKNLLAGEVVDLGTYDDVMRRLREKVVKEVLGGNIREALVRHLGERFGLLPQMPQASLKLRRLGN